MQIAPFSVSTTHHDNFTEQDFASGKFVLYAYPKDSTPGCTIESKAFQALQKEFKALGFSIFGISKDSVASHRKFCERSGMTFPLIAVPELQILNAFGVMKEKSMFGKKYLGIERSTFVIVDGQVIKDWRKVKVAGHAAAVLEFCKTV